MDDAFTVCCVQRVGNVDADFQQSVQFDWATPNEMLERSPIEELHNNEELPLVLPDLMDGTNIGMIEGGGCLGFAHESIQGLLILLAALFVSPLGYLLIGPLTTLTDRAAGSLF